MRRLSDNGCAAYYTASFPFLNGTRFLNPRALPPVLKTVLVILLSGTYTCFLNYYILLYFAPFKPQ
ncbi:hypothetical protein HMPREF0080_01681 [Anaeroglobus geminatus F0357]|uniref:Uncharacterized protein n=1 Tax=Anaeroglobus geminatus F0357 TaxID=861450 RepID=G9YJ37_9FIRM|nr:hypothetical protein HMPREF0080_01681 [Anaeroglobus geminatus F0357]